MRIDEGDSQGLEHFIQSLAAFPAVQKAERSDFVVLALSANPARRIGQQGRALDVSEWNAARTPLGITAVVIRYTFYGTTKSG